LQVNELSYDGDDDTLFELSILEYGNETKNFFPNQVIKSFLES
jgi:hypothetical protein